MKAEEISEAEYTRRRRARFADEWKIPLAEVEKLVRLARQAGDANTHFSNGDPFLTFKGDVTDSNEASRLWGKEVDRITALIADLVKPYGFTEVVYTGLGPTLKRGAQYVEVPY